MIADVQRLLDHCRTWRRKPHRRSVQADSGCKRGGRRTARGLVDCPAPVLRLRNGLTVVSVMPWRRDRCAGLGRNRPELPTLIRELPRAGVPGPATFSFVVPLGLSRVQALRFVRDTRLRYRLRAQGHRIRVRSPPCRDRRRQRGRPARPGVGCGRSTAASADCSCLA